MRLEMVINKMQTKITSCDPFVARKLAEINAARQVWRAWRRQHTIIKCVGCGGTVAILTNEQAKKHGKIQKDQYCDKCIAEGVPEMY